MAKRKTQKFKLKLKGKTAVFIDWANVYNWKSSLKKIENNKIIAWKRKCKNVPQPKAEGVISFVYTK